MINTAFFWFTGLSGAGKTTVAKGVDEKLRQKDYAILIIDGDDVRERFHCGLGFSGEDIKKNNALILDMCKENDGKFNVVLVPIISPFRESRNKARDYFGSRFYEIYFKTSLDCVVKRDVKGLYAKARDGIVDNLIGFSSNGVAYEAPENPDFIIDSENECSEVSIQSFYDFVISKIDDGEGRMSVK